MGIETGVDLDKLVDVGGWISKALSRRNESRAGSAIYAKRTNNKETLPTEPTITPSTESSEHLLISRLDSTVTITLNNPSKGNVLTSTTIHHLRTTIATFSADPTIQILILTNTGKYFCTGMDLSSSGPATSGTTKEQLTSVLETFECINRCPKTTIALINGSCYGGGVGLAFCCDIRIVIDTPDGDGVKFTLSEVKRGLVPATISKYLVREWGASLTREAMITGRPIPPSELKQRGLIYAITTSKEEAMKIVKEIVKEIGSSAPRAVGQVKELVNAVAERKGEEGVIERVFVDMMGPSEEARYGISEFRKGNRKVDWAEWYREKKGVNGKAKL